MPRTPKLTPSTKRPPSATQVCSSVGIDYWVGLSVSLVAGLDFFPKKSAAKRRKKAVAKSVRVSFAVRFCVSCIEISLCRM